jgi:hypothetical protein
MAYRGGPYGSGTNRPAKRKPKPRASFQTRAHVAQARVQQAQPRVVRPTRTITHSGHVRQPIRTTPQTREHRAIARADRKRPARTRQQRKQGHQLVRNRRKVLAILGAGKALKDVFPSQSEAVRMQLAHPAGHTDKYTTSADRSNRQGAAIAKFLSHVRLRNPAATPDPYKRNQTEDAIGHLITQPLKTISHYARRREASGMGPQAELERVSGVKPFPHLDPVKAAYGLGVVVDQAGRGNWKPFKETAKGLAQIPIAAPAGVVGAVTDPVHVADQLGHDLHRRYDGSYKDVAKRVKKEGAAGEVTDLATVAAPSFAGVGRGFGKAAREGTLGPKAKEFATKPRPKLRVTGGVAREQEVSPNIFKLIGQRTHDRKRVKALEKRNRRNPTRKPGLQPQAEGEVVNRFLYTQRRTERIEQSRTQSTAFQRHRRQRVHELDKVTMKQGLGSLNKHQREATFHVLQGIVSPDNPGRAVAQLLARRERIVAERATRGKAGLPPEVETIDYLVKHADEVFTPKMREFLDRERASHARIGHVGVKNTTALARKLRPQAEELGIPYPYEQMTHHVEESTKNALREHRDDAAMVRRIEAHRDQQLAEIEQLKPEIDRRFVEDVRTAARDAGLPEPVYFQHFGLEADTEGRAAFATGGRRAAPGVKQSDMYLYRGGEAVTSAKAYVQSKARTLKRGENHRLIAAQVDQHAFRPPDAEELRQIFGHQHVNRHKLTGHQQRLVIQHRGLDPNDYALWSHGRFQRAISESDFPSGLVDEGDDAQIGQAVNDATAPLSDASEELLSTEGVKLIPREVYDEIHGSIGASGLPGRVVDKVMGWTSAGMLGLNPAWEAVQVASNLFITGAKARGNVTSFIRSPAFFRELKRTDPEIVAEVDDLFGVGPGEAHGARVHLGAATNSRIVNGFRAQREALSFKWQTQKNKVPLLRDVPLNPIHLMFAADNFQNRYFRRVALYDELRKQAFRDMAHNGDNALRLQGPITEGLSLDPQGRIQALLKDPEAVIRHAESINNVMGDFLRYTAKERKSFKRYVLFYGFLRYSLRLTFYTMPVKHPITASLIAKVGQLHYQEVKDLLGGDETPWAFSKLYVDKTRWNEQKQKWEFADPAIRSGKKKPRTIDLARANPFSNQIVQAATEADSDLKKPWKALTAFMSPAFQLAMNQVYGKDLFTGRVYQPGESGPKILLNEALGTFEPYRLLQKETQPGPSKYYTADSLAWDPQLKKYARSSTTERQAQRREIRAANKEPVLLPQLIPFLPRPDTSLETARKIRADQKKKRKGGVGGWGTGSGGSSGGGGWGSAGR